MGLRSSAGPEPCLLAWAAEGGLDPPSTTPAYRGSGITDWWSRPVATADESTGRPAAGHRKVAGASSPGVAGKPGCHVARPHPSGGA
jgi:hypothetical protein